MGYLRVSIEEARQIGEVLQQNSADRQSDLVSLKSRTSPDAVWEGRQATKYREAYERWERAEKELIEAQNQLGIQVKEIVSRYEQIENGNFV